MAATDNTRGPKGEVNITPASNAALVTPSDSADLGYVTRGISFSAAAALKVTLAGSTTPITIPSGSLAAGIIHPLCVTRIWDNSATYPTNLVAYW